MANIKLAGNTWDYTSLTNYAYTQSIDSTNNEVSAYSLKLPDGTLICAKRLRRTSTNISTSAGNVYTTANVYDFGNWPVAFINRPIVAASVASGANNIWCGTVNGSSNTAAGSIRAFASSSYSSITFVFYVIGIGRWK